MVGVQGGRGTMFLAHVGAWVAGIMLAQAAASADALHLDASVRHAILTEHFRTVVHVRDIPKGVMDAAAAARGPEYATQPLEFADPGEEFQVTDVIVNRRLPGRRLIFALASDDYWLMHYESGGIAHTFHLAIFAIHGGKARFVWHAEVRHKLGSIDDLRRLLKQTDASGLDGAATPFY
jgi:hypothetical protein